MSRFDSIGMFWQDVPVEGGKNKRARVMPPIPETGWRPPRDFPNLSAARCISFDTETYDPELTKHGPGWARGKGHVAGFSIGVPEGYSWYFPVRHTVEPEMNLDPEKCFRFAREALGNPYQPKIGANLIYDVGWMRHEGVMVRGELVDVQFAEPLLDDRAHVSLEVLGQKYLGHGKVTSILRKWIDDYYNPSEETWKQFIHCSPPRLVGPYGEGDATLPIQLAPILYKKLEQRGITHIFQMECALIYLLVEMRFAGVAVDTAKAEQIHDELIKRAINEQKKLDSLVGFGVNINAADSIAKAFDKFQIPYSRTAGTKKNPNGRPSFTKKFLEKVSHPIAEHIREIRRVKKLDGTFLQSYILNSHVNGKVYGSFHPLRSDEGGAVGGRFSSSDPNLQNIPVRDDRCIHGNEAKTCPEGPCQKLGKTIRSIFIPDPGHKQWRKFDESQVEFRMLVHFATGPGAEDVRQEYIRNPKTDYHKMTQKLVEKDTGHEWDRRPIKNLNFGIVFGMGFAKLVSDLKTDEKTAKHFIEQYHKSVPFAKPTMKWAMNFAETYGFMRTVLGRYAYFDLWEPADWDIDREENPALPYDAAIRRYGHIRRAYLHKALNRLLQGSAADLMKMAMLKCWKDGVFDYIGVPRLTVHDELDFSDTGGKDDGYEYVKWVMENAIPLRIPLLTEGDVGPNWGACG